VPTRKLVGRQCTISTRRCLVKTVTFGSGRASWNRTGGERCQRVDGPRTVPVPCLSPASEKDVSYILTI
jgi:hypothetical protein